MAETDLDALRQQIDAIDAELHDLVMRRAQTVRAVATAKAGGAGPVFRPVREAAVLRRLMARHEGDFPLPSLVRIWREIISASVAMQAEVRVEAGGDAMLPLAAEHFGAAIPVARATDARAAVESVMEGRANLAVVPPEGDWIEAFASLASDPLRLAHTLPAVQDRSGPAALVVGLASGFSNDGADASATLAMFAEAAGTEQIAEALGTAGLPAARQIPAPRSGGGQLTLLLFDDYVAFDSAEMAAFLNSDAIPILEGFAAGAFPKPIVL